MENLIPIVVKFPANWLLQFNWASYRLFLAAFDQPMVRKMYQKGPRQAAELSISSLGLGFTFKDDKLKWTSILVPPKIVENLKNLMPKPYDIDSNIIGFGNIWITNVTNKAYFNFTFIKFKNQQYFSK